MIVSYILHILSRFSALVSSVYPLLILLTCDICMYIYVIWFVTYRMAYHGMTVLEVEEEEYCYIPMVGYMFIVCICVYVIYNV